MTRVEPVHGLPAAWRRAATAPGVTAELAQAALDAMELNNTRLLVEQRPVADRIMQAMTEAGNDVLAMRAELVLANITIRQGDPIRGGRTARDVRRRAELVGDLFVLARCEYLLAWTAYFVGDTAETRIHATRCVDLLPSDAALGVQIDHTVILAVAWDGTPDGQRYFGEALALAHRSGDTARTLTLYNNIAYSAMERGDMDTALTNVEKMLAESARSNTSLRAIHVETVARAYILSGQHRRAIDALEPLRAAVYTAGRAEDASANAEYYAEPHALCAGLMTLARAHRELGELSPAQDLLDRTRQLVEAGRLTMFEAQILEEQSQISAARGDFRAAFETYVQFHDATVARTSEAKLSRARQIQATFDADRNRRDADRFRDLAMKDALTGLHNRRFLDEFLAQQVEVARRTGRSLSAAIIDVDFFKRVNDELSHKVGDVVLQALASLLVGVSPAGAEVCRLGGEEFVVAMPGLRALEAFDACDTIRRAVASFDWEALTHSIPVTVSVGVSTAARGRTSPSALLADADRNLYAAKRTGRNKVMGDAVLMD